MKEAKDFFFGSDMVANIWAMKYKLEDEHYPEETYRRCAHELWLQLTEDHKDTPILSDLNLTEDELTNSILNRDIVLQGRPMLGLGNPDLVSVSNCVVIESPSDSYEDIIATRYRMVELYKRGCGCGFNINTLRPRGVKVHNCSNTSTGAASFVDGFSSTTIEVAQLGRRGALMIMINAKHPDAEEFIDLKTDLTKCKGANLSVQTEDDFINAAINNEDFIQVWPIDTVLTDNEKSLILSSNYDELVKVRDSVYAKRKSANKLWKKIIYNAWKSAEPGLAFWTRHHNYSPSSVYPKYENRCTNPCIAGSMMVTMGDGSKKMMSEIKEGDMVMTFNEVSQILEPKKVLWSGKTKSDAEVVTVGNIICTPDHLFYNPDNKKKYSSSYDKGMYCEAQSLQGRIADSVLTMINGQLVKLPQVTSHKNNIKRDVYDITVEDNHNFFVNDVLVHNCGEIPMAAYDTCRLLAVNLYNMVDNPFTLTASINETKLYRTCYIIQLCCDALVSQEIKKLTKIKNKIINDPILTAEQRNLSCDLYDRLINSAKEGRRTGAGYLGLADMFTSLGWVYGDDRIETVFKLKCKAEYDASIEMARYHKPFDGFDRSIEENCEFNKMIKTEFPDTYKSMMKYGRRNVSLSTVAPTGTVALLAGVNGGIEPYFRVKYKRRVKLNEWQEGAYKDEDGIIWLDTWRYEVKYEYFMNNFRNRTDVDYNHIMECFDANQSDKVSIDNRIKVQSLSQKYCTHSISSTVNLPSTATVEDVEKVYIQAWMSGLKGVTVYRDGSRTGVLISEETEKKRQNEHPVPTKFKRPKSLPAKVLRFKNNKEKWVALVSYFDNKPIEIFTESESEMFMTGLDKVTEGEIIRTKINGVSKYDFIYDDSNSGDKAILEDITRSLGEYSNYARFVSGLLKYNVPIEQVYFTVDGLKFDQESIHSWKNGILRILKKYIKDGTKANGIKCPSCGEELVFVEGCMSCTSCGWSKCG